MGSEIPVLEYARVERDGGDRYRLWFLLAGLPALVGMSLPIAFSHSLVSELLRVMSVIAKSGFVTSPWVEIVTVTVVLTPCSALVWRVLRMRGGHPGQILGIIGLTFAGIHVVGILGLLSIIRISGECDLTAKATVAGIAVLVCGGFIWWSRTRLGLAVCVLLLLGGVEMAFYAMIVLIAMDGGSQGWGVVFGATTVVRGLECAHVLRSRWRVEQGV